MSEQELFEETSFPKPDSKSERNEDKKFDKNKIFSKDELESIWPTLTEAEKDEIIQNDKERLEAVRRDLYTNQPNPEKGIFPTPDRMKRLKMMKKKR